MPRINQMFGAHPIAYGARDLTGTSEKAYRLAREEMGMGLEKGKARRAGQMLGRVASDLVEDSSRAVWWLLNAPQATGAVISESVLGKALPELFETTPVLGPGGNPISIKQGRLAKEAGIISDATNPQSTIGNVKIENGQYIKPKYSGTMKTAALALPSGVAINSAFGLLTPMGGAEGFKAVFPSDEDPSKTNNPVMEVGAKYFLGRRGGILPWEEFKQVRPDVSKDEYMRYKAYKYDKRTDLNPFDDGQVVLPLGIGKASMEGVQGPEVEMLGSTIPVTTGIVPYATSLAGGILGGRTGRGKGKVAQRALLGGLAGTAGGMAVGNLLEAERRRRNAADNEYN